MATMRSWVRAAWSFVSRCSAEGGGDASDLPMLRQTPMKKKGVASGATITGRASTKCQIDPLAYALVAAYGHSCRSHISQCHAGGSLCDSESAYTGLPYSRQPA